MASIPEPIFPWGHRPTLIPTPIGGSSIPRIRILLAPYMSPYVVPMKKAETWEVSKQSWIKLMINAGRM